MFPNPKHDIPLQALYNQSLTDKDLSLLVLRSDQIDPVISGNKWFKLKHNLLKAQQQGYQTLLSFGGPYSNHLHALAAAGKAHQFNTIGVIRGEEHLPLNPTLADIVAQGMKLYYINRISYRNKHTPEVINRLKTMIAEDDPFFDRHKSAKQRASNFFLLPEGGTNDLAVKGAAEIASFIPENTDYVCVPCGTGGTIAGIINGLNTSGRHQTRVLGFAALKGGQFLEQTISHLLFERESGQTKLTTRVIWQLLHDYHFGGFGKINQSLALFIHDFEKKYPIALDPIYTAKMMYAIVSLIEEDFFPKGSKIVAVHTGGLQGRRAMEQKIQTLIAKAT